MNLDHTQDLSGADQHRLTQLYRVPDFVKQANHEQLYGEPDNLPPHVYAGETKRVYPCHTKAATWMSALFFGDKKSQLPDAEARQIESRIIKAAEYFSIKPDVVELWYKMTKSAASGMSQLVDDDFALVFQAGESKERHYPLRNALEVKQASQWFGAYHKDFTFNDKSTIANKILSKAASFGATVDNSELLDRCAGFGYCAAEDAAKAWDTRAGLVHRQFPSHAAQAIKVATSIRSATFEVRDQGIRIKMAGLMDQFDRETLISKLYDAGGLERPEETLFKVTEKVAADFLTNHAQTTTGAVYEKTALEKLSIDTVRQWMGSDFADAVGGVLLDTTKLAEIIPTMPRPDAEMFERMAQSTGIPVMGRTKAAMDQGMTRAEMEQLAAQYDQTDSLNQQQSSILV